MFGLIPYFDDKVNQCSPCREDFVRVVKKDEKGNEFVVYEVFDSAAYQKSLGFISDWSLQSLVTAGIDPRFNIQTGFNSRLEGISVIENASRFLETIFESEKSE